MRTVNVDGAHSAPYELRRSRQLPAGGRIQDENAEGSKPHSLTLAALRTAVADWAAFLEGGPA